MDNYRNSIELKFKFRIASLENYPLTLEIF